MSTQRRVPLALISASLVLHACGSDKPGGPSTPASVATVTIAVTSPGIAGTTAQATATPRDASGNALTGRTLAWSSNDETVATVDASGLVTVVYPGTATLSATSEGKTGTASFVAQLDPAFAAASGRVGAGASSSCGIKTGGAGYCWGANFAGQLGDGTETDRTNPVAVTGGLNLKSISVGVGHACALNTAGKAYCWGANDIGALGDGTATNRSAPVAVSGTLTFTSISAGLAFSCGVATDGAAYCWGLNSGANLGIGNATDKLTPTKVTGTQQFTSVAATNGDESLFACGLTTTGAIYCWGENGQGQLGGGSTSASNVPVLVSGGRIFQSVGIADAHACGLTVKGEAYCWGYNHRGQLGDGTTVDRSAPVAVTGGLRFAALSVGEVVNCGLLVTGAAYCWGTNAEGQIGNGGSQVAVSQPTPVSGSNKFATIAIGWNNVCGLTTAGQALCWATASPTGSRTPTALAGWN